MPRKKTRPVKVGNVTIGGLSPVSVQSMTKTFTSDAEATIKQIQMLEEAGCQIVRVAVKDEADANALGIIKRSISIPLVADIHFDHKLALTALEAGIDKLRINPGNIGDIERIKAVVSSAKEKKVPIRIGVNSGSLDKEILKKHGHPTAQALVESALKHVKILEKLKFSDIVVSIKASDVPKTIEAYQILSKKVDYPLHVGITEAGIPKTGIIRSAVGIGSLLSQGIGDTIRVSLTGSPVEEVRVGFEILRSLNMFNKGVTIISCPTCGRLEYDMEHVVKEIEENTRHIEVPLKIAIMGCVVNGPGEAAEADLGLAGGKGQGMIFKKGELIKKVREEDMVSELLREIESMAYKL
ncbi:MAG: flavodoxin-dependent (E)-4-hydroxy-3-methylbut-2-enyl-diphosphate synthase [Candidatus Saganbacteria bacterium]|nr:flavodoxin-dependent (E)-4-hydroxy-3-methylbut-2-enyl-diphosphate synthase [Candidatus Saganbacteria bacterium]